MMDYKKDSDIVTIRTVIYQSPNEYISHSIEDEKRGNAAIAELLNKGYVVQDATILQEAEGDPRVTGYTTVRYVTLVLAVKRPTMRGVPE